MARKASTLDVKVNADTTGLERGYKRAGKETQRFTKQTNSLGDSIKGKLGAAFAGIAIGAFATKLARAAAETVSFATAAEEAANKARVVFGTEGQAMVGKWADGAVTAFGMSGGAALEAAGSFGNLLTSFGVTSSEAADMSKTLVALSADLNSFNNRTDAAEALLSGLSGEMEGLKKFGVVLSDVRLRAEAMNMGLEVTGATLDPLTKAMASYSLIMKDTKNAQGDFARTSDGLANTQRILKAAVDDAKETIGKGFVYGLKEATAAMGGPGGMADTIDDLATDVGDLAFGIGALTRDLAEMSTELSDATNGALDLATVYRYSLAAGTAGLSESLIRAYESLRDVGKAEREVAEEAEYTTYAVAALEAGYRANSAAAKGNAAAQYEVAAATRAVQAAADMASLSRKAQQQQDAAGRAKWRAFDEDLARRRKAQEELNKAAQNTGGSGGGGGGGSSPIERNEKAIERYDRKLDAYSKKWKRQTDVRVQALNDEVAAWERVADTVTGAFNTSLGAAIDDYTDKLASIADLDQKIADAIAAGDEKGAAKAAAEKAALGHVEDYVTAWLAQLEYNTAVKNKIAAAMATFVADNPGLAKGAEALTAELLTLDPATADAAITKMVNEGTLAKIAGTLQTEAAKDNVVSVAMADMFYAAGITAAEENLRAITEEMESDKAKKKLEKIGKKAGKTLGDALANEIRQAVNQAVASANAARAAAGRRIAAAPATAGANTRSTSAGPVNIHVHAAVADPVAVGRTVENVLNKRASRLGL